MLSCSGSLTVSGIGKWNGNTAIEPAVETYIIQNGEYSTHSMTYLNLDDDIQEEVYLESILEKVTIENHPRIPVLNGQFGIRFTLLLHLFSLLLFTRSTSCHPR